MSRFLDAVEAEMLPSGRRRAINMWNKPQVTHDMVSPTNISFQTGVEHRVGVNYMYHFWLPEENPEAVRAAIRNVREEIRREVYGDAIKELTRLERAIINGDEGKAQDALRALWKEMAG